jgi:biopolymer transport protein ExbD
MPSAQSRHHPGADANRVVTPMLDVTFQLFFHFVINFRPPVAEGQIDLALPAVPEQAGVLAEQKSEYRLIVAAPRGRVEGITFHSPGVLEELPEHRLFEALDERLRGIADRKPAVTIGADRRLRYSELTGLLDRCRRAGLREVGVQLRK